MMLCTFAPSGPDCLEAGQSPPDDSITDRTQQRWLRTLFNGYDICIENIVLKKKVKQANLRQAGDSSYLRVEVSAVWKLLNHN